MKHARSLLLEAENARLAVKSQREPSGKLRIGAFSSLCTAFLPDLLRQYHQLYPKVDLVVRSGDVYKRQGPHRGKAPPDGVFSQTHHQIAQEKGRCG